MARRGGADFWIEHYGKPCIGADLVKVEWYPGIVAVCHKGTERVWQALGAIYLAYNYVVPTSYTGDYNCRVITGGGSWSGHAWPVAKDVNAKTNPYINHAGSRTIRWGIETDMPAAMIREIESITASGIQALAWGGRWNTVKDAMHFQLRVTLVEIAGGVWSPRGFYEGGGIIPPTPEPEGAEMLKRGDSGNAVRKHQEALNGWGDLGLDPDGKFGPDTETGVKKYQRAADLDQTGVIGAITSPLLLMHHPDATGGGGGTEPLPHDHEATTKIGVSA